MLTKRFLLKFLLIAFVISSCANLTNAPINQPTESISFAIAEISKPTYTPSPTVTFTPTNTPTITPEPIAQAEIIVDTPTSEYVAPVVQNIQAESPAVYTGGKYILVDISQQHMYVYEGDVLVFSFVASTGMNNATRVGNFSVLNKIPNAYGATWNIWMPNWLGIYWAGSLQNGIHALPILPSGAQLWAGYLGVPISYGCVVLGAYESQLLYDWAEIGTPVEIQW
ncbi:MAG: L,D-transpeptidase [Anaerolineales bacterium]|nr:L,D-transpeptidase [Anaerolineales bacterium]